MAYLCGVFAGDGSINYRSNKNEYSLKCVGNPLDEKDFYNIIIIPLFKEVFGFSPHTKLFDGGTTYGFIVYSKTLLYYLTATIGLPLGVKYNSLRIPLCFVNDRNLTINFIRGVFDTDGCISFKKKYKLNPYYPVISLSSKSELFVREIASYLKREGFKLAEVYNYKLDDNRVKAGFTTINRIELNGRHNLKHWCEKIGFWSPKHNDKIKKYGKNSEGWI